MTRSKGQPRLTTEQQRLAADNMPLARWHANVFSLKTQFDFDDCLGEALIGLCNAARLFNPNFLVKGSDTPVRFSTYATWAIRSRLARMLEVERRRPDDKALGLAAGSVGHDGYGKTRRGEAFVDPPAPQEVPKVEMDEVRKDLRLALSGCSYRQARVLHWKFVDGMNLAQIGERLGLSRERVRQIQVAALSRVRRTVEGA